MNTIDTQLRDPINSGLTRWRMAVLYKIFRLSMEMSRLMRDGTAEPVSRDQILRRECVCFFFPFILDIKFVGRTSRVHTGGRSHRISHPPSFCGAYLNFSRDKD